MKRYIKSSTEHKRRMSEECIDRAAELRYGIQDFLNKFYYKDGPISAESKKQLLAAVSS